MNWTPAQKQILAMPVNLCVLAGAGSGKTMTLVELVIRYLDGELSPESDPDLRRVLALTYTEKAAREMRDRIRISLNDRIKTTPPNRKGFWERQRGLLDRAQIGTIHGFCSKVIRQHGPLIGVDPDFSIIEDEKDFHNDLRRNTLLNWIKEESEDLLGLLDHYAWISVGRGRGLDRILAAVYGHGRTFGRKALPAESVEIPIQEQLVRLHESAELIDRMLDADEFPRDKGYVQKLIQFARYVHQTDFSDAPRDPAPFLAQLAQVVKGNWYRAKPAKEIALTAVQALTAETSRRLALPVYARISQLARDMEKVEAREKERLGLLDFDDLLLETRELLANHPFVRQRYKERFDLVLVDEFQDTNRLQADLVAYLVEKLGAETIPGPGESPVGHLEPEPRKLVVFGDPKQSIYRFRGAEVAVFDRFKQYLTEDGQARMIPLDTNFRSQKRLVDFFNAFFSGIMEKTRPFESEYGEHDRQRRYRQDQGPGPGAVLLVAPKGRNASESRGLEAAALASYIREIVSGRVEINIGDGKGRAQAADIAVLLRRFTHLKAYERAFQNLGLPYYTVRGRGFYQCPEVWDLINLLLYLMNPDRTPSLLGVLRSPLFGLTDDLITRLVWPEPMAGPVEPDDLLFPGARRRISHLPAEESDQVQRSLDIIARLKSRSERAFPAELVESAVEETDYLAVLIALDQGRQKVANVKRFIEIMRDLPQSSQASPTGLTDFLEARLEDTGDDPEALVADDTGAVRIMTIHQAKGLQFPVVFVPDCGQSRRAGANGPVLFGPDDRFALRFTHPDTRERCEGPAFQEFLEEERARENAEHQRLLYVAATRAQDHLVFSGTEDSGKPGTWLHDLEAFAEVNQNLLAGISEPGPGAPVTVPPNASLSDQDPLFAGNTAGPLPEPGTRAREIMTGCLDRRTPRPDRLTLSVTGLSQYLDCPRRFYLESVLGLPAISALPGEENGQASHISPREMGNIFHGLMERLDLDHIPSGKQLQRIIEDEAAHQGVQELPGEHHVNSLAAGMNHFLSSPWGADMLKAHGQGGILLREAPVLLKLEAGDGAPALALTGEIDLFYIVPDGPARIIDYKFAPPGHTRRYQAQLKTYALALSRIGLSRKLEAGLFFVEPGQGTPAPLELESGWMVAFEAQLRAAAQEIARMSGRGGEGPAVRRPCPDPGCGLAYMCEDPSRTGDATCYEH